MIFTKKIMRFSFIGLGVLLLYILIAWFFVYKTTINLFVANALSFSITFLVALLSYRYLLVQKQNKNALRGLPVAMAALFSLSVSEYFVFFFSEYGQVNGLLIIAFSAIISLVYFAALSVFFNFRKPHKYLIK